METIQINSCGIPNPKTDDPCVLEENHVKVNLWHKDGSDKEWLGKPPPNAYEFVN